MSTTPTRHHQSAGAHSAGHMLAETMIIKVTGDRALARLLAVNSSPIIEAFADTVVLLHDTGYRGGAELPSTLPTGALSIEDLPTQCSSHSTRRLCHALLADQPTLTALATIASQHWDILEPTIKYQTWLVWHTAPPPVSYLAAQPYRPLPITQD